MSFINFLFPTQCIFCSKVGEYICESCLKKIPRCLQCCPVCGKLSSNYSIHRKCSKAISQGFTGWYTSIPMKIKFDEKMRKGVYSTHLYLLNNLIQYLSIDNIVKESYLYPLYSNDNNTYILNSFLCKSIFKKGKKRDLLFVGSNWDSINKDILSKRGLPIKKPSNCRILVLFQQTNPR